MQTTPPLFFKKCHAYPVVTRFSSIIASILPEPDLAAEARYPWDFAFTSSKLSHRGYFD
jgi:hypothetical protein